nr:hypothetical protein [Tanacetum cinerariifolium]
MLENGRIANLALQGGSGEGYGSLPTDFEVVEGRKKGGKGVCKLGGKGCTVYSDAQCFKYGDGVTWIIFDKEKPVSSYEFREKNSWMKI